MLADAPWRSCLASGAVIVVALVAAGCGGHALVDPAAAHMVIPVQLPSHAPYGCGAEAAVSVARYYGKNAEVTDAFAGARRWGDRAILVDVVAIRAYLHDRGLPARVEQLTVAQINRHLDAGRPVILFTDLPLSDAGDQFPVHCSVLCGYASPQRHWLYAAPDGRYARWPHAVQAEAGQSYTTIVIHSSPSARAHGDASLRWSHA